MSLNGFVTSCYTLLIWSRIFDNATMQRIIKIKGYTDFALWYSTCLEKEDICLTMYNKSRKRHSPRLRNGLKIKPFRRTFIFPGFYLLWKIKEISGKAQMNRVCCYFECYPSEFLFSNFQFSYIHSAIIMAATLVIFQSFGMQFISF